MNMVLKNSGNHVRLKDETHQNKLVIHIETRNELW